MILDSQRIPHVVRQMKLGMYEKILPLSNNSANFDVLLIEIET